MSGGSGRSRVPLKRTFNWTDKLLGPLGLSLAETPRLVPGGRLRGPLVFAGERHGRTVTITQLPSGAVTSVAGSCKTTTLTDAYRIAGVAGERLTDRNRCDRARHLTRQRPRALTRHVDQALVSVGAVADGS